MNKKVLKQMRETEEVLLSVVKGVSLKADRIGVMKPVELEAAKVLVYLYEIEAGIKDEPAEWEEIAAAVHEVEPPELENKQAIAEKLLQAVQLTRAGAGINRIEIDQKEKWARIVYKNGGDYSVDIEADSGIAMIRDICRGI